MRHRIGCVAFTIAGLAWLAFVAIDLLGAVMGDCVSDDDACTFYRPYVEGFVFWRGLSVALLLILGYVLFRAFTKDDDVQ